MKSLNEIIEIVLRELKNLVRSSSSCWIAEDDIADVCFKDYEIYLMEIRLALRFIEDDGLIEYDKNRGSIRLIETKSQPQYVLKSASEEMHS